MSKKEEESLRMLFNIKLCKNTIRPSMILVASNLDDLSLKKLLRRQIFILF